jgi:hypothetical protein
MENRYDFAAYDPQSATKLLAFDKKSGEQLAQLELEARPVFDGLIAAGGRLYATTMNGDILCLGAKQ